MRNILLAALFLNALYLIGGQQYFVTKIFSMPHVQSKIIYSSQSRSAYQSGSFFQSVSFMSLPTFAPTFAPTFMPSFVPTLAPPTLAPTLAPTTFAPTTFAPTTFAPTTFAPTTFAPTFAPTLAPTLALTFMPSFAPTLAPPTLAPTPAPKQTLNFEVEGTLTNLSYPILTTPDKQCIITATAKSMNISNKYVTFADNRRRKLLANINYKTEINYPLKNKGDATNVYNVLTNTLMQSVSSGNFNNYMRQEAQQIGATNILNAVVANVSSTPYTVIQTNSKKNNKKSNINNFLFFAFIIVALPLTYIKCKECTEPNRKYNNRRNYYFSMLFSENSNNSGQNTELNAI